jgi:hypothetical protein
VIGGEAKRATPLAPDSHLADLMNQMALSAPVDAPWKAPNAAEWDKMTLDDFLDQLDLAPAVRMGVKIPSRSLAAPR